MTFVGAAIFGGQVVAQFSGDLHSIVPAAPTTADLITAIIYGPSHCVVTFNTVVSGSLVRTDALFHSCGGGPAFPVIEFASFGPLPPGTYTYQVYSRFEGSPAPPRFGGERTFVVAPAPGFSADVPALDTVALSVLALSMALVAYVSLRRMTG